MMVNSSIEDYLFVYSNSLPADGARQAARQYFSQGHEINFVQVQEWMVNNLATIGGRCRGIFTKELLALFDTPGVPAAVKVAWNDIVKEVVGM